MMDEELTRCRAELWGRLRKELAARYPLAGEVLRMTVRGDHLTPSYTTVEIGCGDQDRFLISCVPNGMLSDSMDSIVQWEMIGVRGTPRLLRALGAAR